MIHGLGALVAIFGAAIVRTDRRLVRHLKAAGAESDATAIPLAPSGRLARWRLARLESVGAIRRHATGAVHLDAAGWAAYRRTRRRRALAVVAVLLPVDGTNDLARRALGVLTHVTARMTSLADVREHGRESHLGTRLCHGRVDTAGTAGIRAVPDSKVPPLDQPAEAGRAGSECRAAAIG